MIARIVCGEVIPGIEARAALGRFDARVAHYHVLDRRGQGAPSAPG